MSRAEFSRKTRAAVFLRANGCCEGCRAKLKAGEGEVDHILPDVLGGEPTIENAQLLCRVCHRAKTADDIRRTRKADRQRDKHTGAWKKSSRSMPNGRNSPTKRKVNGQLVHRDTDLPVRRSS
ncbi:HNH endonuclease signature motif containing protein [Chelatococcus sp. YT9]|uniref:HNH endonuclease n=1 Tax=Chelatococcus sp. YT9 TaxID=2835635 RepID=UPI001BCFC7BD|nr:HNH endonuclease signature motif containing protein [Chelatococcus sp. YT9]MBS7698570.1 HNH endonuclease [Chelatococcus sp. YT9]